MIRTVTKRGKTFGTSKRKTVQQETLVSFSQKHTDTSFLGIYEAKARSIELKEWLKLNRDTVMEQLLKSGALLFRGFQVDDSDDFEQVIEAGSEASLEYKFRASPRTEVSGNIFTSTDYPADQVIFPHNEHSYSPRFPLHLYFYCQMSSAHGGATTIADNRAIYQSIPKDILAKFREKGVMYVRNYGDGFGLPLNTVFQTEDRAKIDVFCRAQGIETVWKSNGRLTTKQTGPALMNHPHTGETLWFNHATFFHITTMPKNAQEELLRQFDSMELPTNTFYGDGSEIELPVLDILRECYQKALLNDPWVEGDVMLLDNMLAVHGREPYAGARRILVGMAQPVLASEVDTKKLSLEKQTANQ